MFKKYRKQDKKQNLKKVAFKISEDEEEQDDPEEGSSGKTQELEGPPRKKGLWRRKSRKDKEKEEEEWIGSKGKMQEDTSETRVSTH